MSTPAYSHPLVIRVIDLETTGFAPPEHAVVEIGWCEVVSTALNLAGEPASFAVRGGVSMLLDPGRPIPPEASAVHHIVDEDVRGLSAFADMAPMVTALSIPLFAAHSADFERQWLDPWTAPRPWICTYKCALRLWREAPAHSNQALRYWRRPAGLDRARVALAHRAGPDAYVTAHLLRDLLDAAPLEKLIAWSAEPALQVFCRIGEWRGRRWSEVDEGFLHWVLRRDFGADVLFTARHELARRAALRQEETEDA